MSASCPSLTKGLDGALLYERDVSFCCLHFTAAAGVVVPFSQVDAFSFCRKCIYVLNSLDISFVVLVVMKEEYYFCGAVGEH